MNAPNPFLSALARVNLIRFEDPAPSAPDPSGPPAAVPSPSPVVAPSPSVIADPAKYAEIDQTCREKLIRAMANDGAPLPEELAETLATLSAIPDEGLRYSTALKLMSRQGSTVGKILSDYDKTLGVLEETSRAFEASTQAQIQSKVGSKQTAVETMTAAIESKRAQIEQLQREIAELTVKRDTEQAGISDEQQKIVVVQQRFGIIYTAIRNEVMTQRSKVAQYGGVQ